MTIKLFTTPGCVWCEAVKEFLRTRRAAFQELDVTGNFANLRAMRRLTPGRQVPVTARGQAVVVGYHPEALEKLLAEGSAERVG